MCQNVELDVDSLNWEKADRGLLPAVVQDASTGRVLMVANMDRRALARTLETGWVTFWSRSRETLWTKGETSGNRLRLVDMRVDCDRDALLVTAEPGGPVCHTGTETCFDQDTPPASMAGFLGRLETVIEQRRGAGETSYTARLLSAEISEVAKKVGEEGVEVALSASQSPNRTVEESADLLYHLLVLLRARDLSLGDVLQELVGRHRPDS